MKLKTTLVALCALFFAAYNSNAQVFWTEDFTSACASLCTLPYTSGNGTWNAVATGANGAAANIWYVSKTETDPGRGQCSSSSTDATLHIGNVSTSPAASLFCPTGDCGSAYDASPGAPSVRANTRATSPVINCTGRNNITLSFNYLMNGQAGHDYMTVWYFDGSIWSLLNSPATTPLCGMQGRWVHHTVAMPASANNNANVQIGFNWQNDTDGLGNDPSVAVDSVQLSVAVVTPPVAKFKSNDTIICAGDSAHFIDLSTGGPTSWLWTFTGGNPATSTLQNPTIYYGTPGYYTVKEVVKNVNGKDSITKVNYIHVVAHPVVVITPNTTICADSTITLTASGGVKYNWSTGATTSSINVTPNATKTYTVTVSNDTCSTVDSVKVTVDPLPTVTLSGITTICKGDSTMISATGGGTYLWSTGATTSAVTVKPTSTKIYNLKVTNGGCSKDTSVTITVNPSPNVTFSGNTSICKGDSTIITATGGGTYLWTNNGSTNASITVKPTADSTFYIHVTNGGCTKDTSIKIKVNPKPVPSVGQTQTICQGLPVNLTASGGTSYLWRPNSTLNDSTIANPIATPSVTTEYTVYVSNGGCTAIDSEKVIVVPAIPITASASPTIISQGGSSNLNVTPVAGATYSWTPSASLSCASCITPTATPTVTTWYYIDVTEPDGCVERDSVLVIVKEKCGDVFVPNAFSPNGDGQNDQLIVMCNPACVTGFDFKIYDRWGNLVFQSNDPSVGWDGKYKGVLMNPASFVYYLDYLDVSNNNAGVSKKGSITLVR